MSGLRPERAELTAGNVTGRLGVRSGPGHESRSDSESGHSSRPELMKMMTHDLDAIKGQCRPALPRLSNQFKSSQDVPLTEGMFSALFTATVTATVTRDFKFRRVGRA